METTIIEERINRIVVLMNRLQEIPEELDEIHERLYTGLLTSQEFKELVNRRSSLLIEQKNKKCKLRELYHIIDDQEHFESL